MAEDFKFKRPDTYRQYLESEKMTENRSFESLCLRAGQALCDFLKRELNCDGSKVVDFLPKLSFQESGISGDVEFHLESYHKGELKSFNIPIKVEKNEMILPEKNIVEAVLCSTDSARTITSLKLKTEIDENIEKINQHEEFKRVEAEKINTGMDKVAVSAPHAGNLLSETLKINKDFLPSGLKVGDVIYLDSSKYRVVSGDDDKLSVEGSGVYWTLNKLIDTLKEDEVVINSQDKF